MKRLLRFILPFLFFVLCELNPMDCALDVEEFLVDLRVNKEHMEILAFDLNRVEEVL